MALTWPWRARTDDRPPGLERELARRVFRMARRLVGIALLGYGLMFALAGVWLLAGLCVVAAGLVVALSGRIARGDRPERGLSLIAWLLLAGLAAAATQQGGLGASALWWIFALPVLLVNGQRAAEAVAMSAVIASLLVGLWWAGAQQLLPPPRLMPLGELQRAISALGALLLLTLIGLRTQRWRRRLVGELQRARTQAEDAGRSRERFIGNISHEIRTPLNGVIGAADLLHLSRLDAGQRRTVDVLRQSAQALHVLVDDMLDFAQLEAGAMTLEHEPVDVREVLHGAAELLATQAQGRGLELWAHCGPTVPRHVMSDANRLRQVVHKLASNAVKFTDAGSVRLSASVLRGRNGPQLALTVRDTGVGMTAEQQAGLFEAFAQGDPSTTRRHGGAGLGLALCAQMAALLGGRIRLRSEPGAGSTFAVCLPWPADDTPPARLASPLSGLRVWVVSPTETLRADLAAVCREAGVRCDLLDALPGVARLAQGAATGLRAVLVDDAALRQAGVGLGLWAQRLALLDVAGVWLGGLGTPALAVPDALVPLYKPARPARLLDALAQAVRQRADSTRRAAAQAPSPAAQPPAAAGTPTAPRAAPRPAPAAPPAAARPQALLAEDNPVNQLVTSAMLERCGFEVTLASAGHEAIRQFAHRREAQGFSVVLMDCHMPGLDGFEATRSLRRIEARDGGPRTPVIAISADTEAYVSGKCQAAGMDDFLAKPVHLDRLASALRRWNGGAGLAKHGTQAAPGGLR